MEEFDFYEIKEWIADSVPGKKHFLQALSYNPHPFASSVIETNIDHLPPRYFITNCHHMLCEHNNNNNKLRLFLRLKERNTSEIIPYDIYSELLLYYHLDYQNDLLNLKESLQERKGERNWKYGKLVQHVCLTEKMEKIKEIPYKDLNWCTLSANHHPCVIDFLRENKKNVLWTVLAKNSSDCAVDLLFESEIDWFAASFNTNDRVTSCFPQFVSKISISGLCTNTSDFVVKWLLEDPDMYSQIIWSLFCTNENNYAVEHIYNISLLNPRDKRIEWGFLCTNRNKMVFRILRNNQSKIHWEIFLNNPICFEYNYEMMEKRVSIFKEELIGAVFSPERIMHLISVSRENEEDDFEIISKLDF